MHDPPFRIALDMRGLQTRGRFRGVGNLWRELLGSLAAIDREHRYYLIYAQGHASADDGIDYPDNFRKIGCRVPFFPGTASAPWLWSLDSIRQSRIVRKLDASILIDTTFADLIFPSRPLPGIQNLIWVYDLIPWLYQDYFVKAQRLAAIKKVMLRSKLRSATRATALITISESTRQDIHYQTGYPLDKITVIPLGVDPSYFSAAKKLSLEARRALDLPDKYILFVGALDPHKNLPRALEAYAAARRRLDVPPLLVVGKVASDLKPFEWLRVEVTRLGLDDRVHFLDWVQKADLIALYHGADYLLFPTLYEGFGLPALEAMAAGCPVLTSNTSSLPEVVGECAVLVNPADTDSIASGMARLGGDPILRATLSARGQERARGFTWQRTAEIFYAFLKGMENPTQ